MELLLPIFLLSGQFKSYLNFFGIELRVDLTLLTAFLLFAFLIYRLYMDQRLVTRQITYVGIGLLLVFYGWLLFSLSFTSSESYASSKAFYFALNIAAFVIPFLSRGFRIRRFIKIFTVATIGLAMVLLPFLFFMGKVWETDAFSDFEAISGLYLSLSGYLGLLVVLHLTTLEAIWKSRLHDRILVLGIIILMMLLGARGPAIFSLFVFGLYYLYNLKAVKLGIGQRTMSIILAGSFGIIVIVGFMLQFESTQALLGRSVSRFIKLVTGLFSGEYGDSSALVRIELYKDAADGIFTGLGHNLTGYGIGSFGIETMGEDIRLYPHNMILEIWFELGFIGLVLFSAWLIYLLSKTIRLPYKQISYWLLIYFFLNLMKSSSLVDIRTEFAFLGIYITQFFIPNTENRIPNADI